uniref:Uncharacterized protein n=1 Tax=Timema poppense TaxID=170557 RepID=A0A7R9GZS4_TIMPO|nr:unnamed protein product [Timema poppensis]
MHIGRLSCNCLRNRSYCYNTSDVIDGERRVDSHNEKNNWYCIFGVLECIVRLGTFKLVSEPWTDKGRGRFVRLSSGESDNDEHFVIETAQSDSDSECNLSDNELEIVPEQSEDLEHDADLGLYIGLLPGSHHTRLPQPSVEGGTSTTSRNEENDDHGVLAVRSPASLARTAYYEYLRILKNVKTQKRNIVLVENSNHLDLGDISVYPDTRGILVVRVYLEKRKSKMELPENVNVAIKFEVTEPKSECVIPSIKEENEMNCNSTKYVNEVVKSEVPDIFEPFSQYDLPLIKEELETELPENIKPEETKPKFVCGIPLIKEENEVNLNSTKYVDGVVKSEGDIFEPFSQCNVPFIKEELEENISGYKRNLRSSEFKTSWRHSSVSRVLEQPGGSGGRKWDRAFGKGCGDSGDV